MLQIKHVKVIPQVLLVAVLLAAAIPSFTASVAAETITCGDGKKYDIAESDTRDPKFFCADKGGEFKGGSGNIEADCMVPLSQVDNSDKNPDNDCGIIKYVLIFINALSALVGIVVVMMIVIAGIQYSTTADNPQTAVEAKKRIANAIGALLLYIFMFAFLQWIVPGGVL